MSCFTCSGGVKANGVWPATGTPARRSVATVSAYRCPVRTDLYPGWFPIVIRSVLVINEADCTEKSPSWETDSRPVSHEVFPSFVEPKGSSPWSQQPATRPYPEPDESNSHPSTLLRSAFYVIYLFIFSLCTAFDRTNKFWVLCKPKSRFTDTNHN
jgi:hypothetical protein